MVDSSPYTGALFSFPWWDNVSTFPIDYSALVTVTDWTADWTTAQGTLQVVDFYNEMSELKVCEISEAVTDLVD